MGVGVWNFHVGSRFRTDARRSQIATIKNRHALTKKNDTAKLRRPSTMNGKVGCPRKSQPPSSHPFPQKSQCKEYRYALVRPTAGIENHQGRKNQKGKAQAKYWNA